MVYVGIPHADPGKGSVVRAPLGTSGTSLVISELVNLAETGQNNYRLWPLCCVAVDKVSNIEEFRSWRHFLERKKKTRGGAGLRRLGENLSGIGWALDTSRTTGSIRHLTAWVELLS